MNAYCEVCGLEKNNLAIITIETAWGSCQVLTCDECDEKIVNTHYLTICGNCGSCGLWERESFHFFNPNFFNKARILHKRICIEIPKEHCPFCQQAEKTIKTLH